ncbi:T-cell surface glycoprotein CD1c [Ctenodactylus gundi]
MDAVLRGSDCAEEAKGHNTFKLIQMSSLVNETWAQNRGSGWLNELQTHGWDSESGTIIFLHTWSKGNFSAEELLDLELLFRLYFSGLTEAIEKYAHAWEFQYPMELQVSAGCELYPGASPKDFFQVGFEGSDFLAFQNSSWMPSPKAGNQAQKVCDLLNMYKGIKDIVKNLLRNTCPRFLLGILDAGKMGLQRQVKPEAWLSSHPTSGSGQLLLVCHISGFYPKPVRVMWMRDEQEQLSAKQDDVLPNADGTWYLRVILIVAAEEASGLSCRVRHSSLGDQDIILYWGHHLPMNLVLLAVTVPLVLLVILVLWLRKRW